MSVPSAHPARQGARLVAAVLPPYLTFGACLGLLQVALPSILQAGGVSISQVGFVALVLLPLCASSLWGPLVDRYSLAGLDRRMTWFVGSQGVIIACLLVMAAVGTGALGPLLAAMCILSFAAATMDVTLDGALAETASAATAALRGGLKVSGMLVGTIVGSTGIMALVEWIGWTQALLALAALSALAAVPFAVAPVGIGGADLRALPSLRAVARLSGIGLRLALVAIIGLALGLGLGAPRLIMIDSGYDLSVIGRIFGTVGPLTGAVGAMAGLGLGPRFGAPATLIGGGAVFALALGATGVILGGEAGQGSALAVAIGLASFGYALLYGMVSSLAMRWVGQRQAATDYAVVQNVWLLSIVVGTSVSGGIYSLAGLAILPICALVVLGVVLLLARIGAVHGGHAAEVPV